LKATLGARAISHILSRSSRGSLKMCGGPEVLFINAIDIDFLF
jgi:hypothetical protein